MRLDLRAVGVPLELLRLDELAAVRDPIQIRPRGMMRIVVADRTVPLGEYRHGLETASGTLQARADVRHLLAEGGRARALAVRAGEHRQLGVRFGQRAQGCGQGAHLGQQHGAARVAQQARVAEIVDVLGSAAEVHEFERGGAGADGRQRLAHEIFHRLDVVVDTPFDGFDGRGRQRSRVLCERRGARGHVCRQGGRQQRGGLAGEPDEPQGLDAYAFTDQRRLGQVLAQRRDRGRIATVHGRERGKGRGFHGDAVRDRNARLAIITH